MYNSTRHHLCIVLCDRHPIQCTAYNLFRALQVYADDLSVQQGESSKDTSADSQW